MWCKDPIGLILGHFHYSQRRMAQMSYAGYPKRLQIKPLCCTIMNSVYTARFTEILIQTFL